MKIGITAIAAAGTLSAATAMPSWAGNLDHQGYWSFGFGNDKVCSSLDVKITPNSENGPVIIVKPSFSENGPPPVLMATVTVKVTNTDRTSEWFVFNRADPRAVAVFDILQAACDHADDNAKGPSALKTYTIFVDGTPTHPGLAAWFGGVVGNLPTAGSPNAGTPGLITQITVKTNNR